jgi:hypothetical protein
MITYKLFSLILGLMVAFVMILLARRSKIRFTQFMWWFSTICSVLIFAFFPTLIDVLGKWVGVSYPPTIISILGLGMILIKVFSMDIYITQNELRYRKLAQKLALFEKRMHDEANMRTKDNKDLDSP